jgi:microcystin-dependent protein
LGNNITYNVFFEASVTDKTVVDGDYVLALQYLADMNSYAVGAVLGELWLTVTTATSITTYKAYAKVLSGGAGAALRFLNGTYEESLATLNVGSSIRLEGTLEYRTGYVADEVSLPKIWTPKGFSENIEGYVGMNNMAVPARARLDIVETATSNLPVLMLDQRGSGALLEMRSNMDDVKLIVDRQGNVGIGTSVARAKLEVAGHIWPSSNLAYDLGSSNLRWRDLYLSGNTIDLGGTFLTRNAEGGGIKITSDSGEDVDTSSRNVNASGYVNINGTRLERHVTGPLMVRNTEGEMESGMFKHVYVDGTVRASNLEILGDFVTLNTVTSNTEQMVIVNAGTGPALKVTQTGANSIAEFYDDGNVLAFKVADGGNVGIGTAVPTTKLDVVGILKANGLQINDITNAFMPRGGIIMWSGTIVAIPTGWALCDGTNGTPNLQGKFLIGSSTTYGQGTTGGTATKTLTEANMPAHNHSGTTTAGEGTHTHTITDPGHQHTIGFDNGAGEGQGEFGTNYNSLAGPYAPLGAAGGSGRKLLANRSTTGSSINSTNSAHTHTFTTSSKGSGTAFDILPPYYALAYIMKL